MKIKPSNEAKFDVLTWVCIYGGLLSVVAGLALATTDESLAWTLGGAGSLATVVGIVLVYIRSRDK